MNAFTVKILAAILMVVDHVGFFFFPEHQIFRIIGRVSFPLFAFLIVNGFRYTKDVKKYFLRLFMFANIIQLPSLFMSIPINVVYTLSFGLLCLILIESESSRLISFLGIGSILVLTYFLNPDYSTYGVLLIIVIYLFDSNYFLMASFMAMLSIISYGIYDIQIFSIIAVIPIFLYNGKPGIRMKYFFYIFYPGHLLLLEGISQLISK